MTKPVFKLLFIVLFFVANAQFQLFSATTLPEKHFSNPARIRYDGSCVTIEGKDIFIYGAAFHYFRTPKELWRDRFAKIKAAGFNTVETYVPWNLCELNMPKNINDYSQFDFTDLKDWLRMAQEEFGFYTVLRPGPFICAEFAGGAYPRWLAKFRPETENFWLRTADPVHINWSEHWYNAVCKIIAQEQLTTKPKNKKGIILMQIENEYDAHDTENKTLFLQRLYTASRNAGVTIPVFTCLTSECRASTDPILSQAFDCDNYYVGLQDAISCAKRMESLKRNQPNAPGFVTELQGGWFSTVMGQLSEEHESNDQHFYAIAMMSIAGGATGLFPYVFVGGTHFSGWGARGQTTSYDYNAAIRENGALSSKYFAAKNVGNFIKTYQKELTHSEGGVCAFKNAPAEVVGGMRVSKDGTRFIFIHNSSKKETASGTTIVQPNQKSLSNQPMYNIDQNEKKVLIKEDTTKNSSLASQKAFQIEYQLAPLETKVLIIPPKATPSTGKWWSFEHSSNTNSLSAISIRIKEVKKHDEDPNDAQWQPLAEGVSLPEIGVNDARYVLYRSKFNLSEKELEQYSHLIFNTFSRDIINAQVNRKQARRLYPSEKWASQVWRDVDKSFKWITPKDFDNRFDIKGLLQKGENEIVLVYENIGHEHGYYPMEELCGIHYGGLAQNDSVLLKKLNWEIATNLAGVQKGYILPKFNADNWQTIGLDTLTKIPRKGNNIEPIGSHDALLTWYKATFKLPKNVSNRTWRLIVNASGNGYIWLNGHNLGRHWEGGPQREFYLPECWLNFDGGANNSIVFGLRQTVNGAKINAIEIDTYPTDKASGKK